MTGWRHTVARPLHVIARWLDRAGWHITEHDLRLEKRRRTA